MLCVYIWSTQVSSTYGGQLLFVPFWKLKEAVEEKVRLISVGGCGL